MDLDVSLHIAGRWRSGGGGETLAILNPATGDPVGRVAVATRADLDEALEAAERGSAAWRRVSAFDRSRVLRRAAALMRERAEDIARTMTREQGKPLAEARIETGVAADIIEWFAEEGRRAYGRVIPARAEGVLQIDPRGSLAGG